MSALFIASALAIPAIAAEVPVIPTTRADIISSNVLGPRLRPDFAYGAFQRGQYLTALKLALERLENAEDGAAQTLIGYIYENGLGVDQDFAKAASWYKFGAQNGDANAAFQLAVIYQSGAGVPQNRSEAANLFEQAAATGHAAAKYNLALLHVEGTLRPPDLARAADLMKQAADLGLADAQYDFGTLLLEGAGIAPDPELSARYIGSAAAQGLTAAQVDYATMFYLGRGLPKDISNAAKWYDRAAGGGNPVAQIRIAKLLAVGEGLDQDLETAEMWRALAARQGLVDPILDDLLSAIAPETASRAALRAQHWPASPPTQVSVLSAQQTQMLAEQQKQLPSVVDMLIDLGEIDPAAVQSDAQNQ